MTRPANAWPEAQRLLREAYAADPRSVPRVPIYWRLYDASAMARGLQSRGAPLAGLALGLKAIFRRRSNEAPVIAVWHADASRGAVAVLTFEFDSWPQSLEGDATLIGECEPNGALGLELSDGTVLWPAYNPRQPASWLPRR